MQKYLATAARVLLSQLFLVQVVVLIIGFTNNPDGYQQYQASLGSMGLPGIFAPLIILVNCIGGLALLLGYKTKAFALVMAFYIVGLTLLLKLPLLQYLAIAGRFVAITRKPKYSMQLRQLQEKCLTGI